MYVSRTLFLVNYLKFLSRFGKPRIPIVPIFYLDLAAINNQPGIIVSLGDRSLHGVVNFEFVKDRISSIFAVVNPEKLKPLT